MVKLDGAFDIPLTEWRRPWRPYLGSYLLLVLLSPLPAVFLSTPTQWLGLSPRPALVVAGVVWLALVASIAWRDHRKQPAGVLSFRGGRLRFDAWCGRAVDVPLSAVRKAVVARYRNGVPACLGIWIGAWRRIQVHEARLGGIRLEEVGSALLLSLDGAGRDRLVAASQVASRRLSRIERAGRIAALLAVVTIVAGVVLRAILD